MKLHKLDRAQERLRAARLNYLSFRNVGIELNGFEDIWYSFLLNFNGFFTILEQACKSNNDSERWFSQVKTFRRTDQLLRYLQHARNVEEHTGLSSIMKSGFILKPKTKGARIIYRDKAGRPLKATRIIVPFGVGFEGEIIVPSVRFRNVVDRGVLYEPPSDYSHPVLDELINSGVVVHGAKDMTLPLLAVALAHAELISAEADNIFRAHD